MWPSGRRSGSRSSVSRARIRPPGRLEVAFHGRRDGDEGRDEPARQHPLHRLVDGCGSSPSRRRRSIRRSAARSLDRDVDIGAQPPHHRPGAANQRLPALAIATVQEPHAAVQVHLPGEAGAAQALGDLPRPLDRPIAIGNSPEHVVAEGGPSARPETADPRDRILLPARAMSTKPSKRSKTSSGSGLRANRVISRVNRARTARFGVAEAPPELLGAPRRARPCSSSSSLKTSR